MRITDFRNRQYLQRGDTIVEVLISIAVVSMVLGGAYVTTNRSLQATRSAQERGNALKNAESQVERIKSLASTNPSGLFAAGTASPNKFCISTTGVIRILPHTDCTVGTNGQPTNSEPKFNLSIDRSGNKFTVTETWTDVSGVGGTNGDKLQMTYRVYE